MGLGPEKKIENALRKAVETHGGWITKTFASPNTNKGIPDLLGVVHGRFIALEVKRLSGGKPTPVQIRDLLRLNAAGAIGLVTNDVSIVTVLDDILDTDPAINPANFAAKARAEYDLAIDLTYLPSSSTLTPAQAAHLWHNPDLPKVHSLLVLPH